LRQALQNRDFATLFIEELGWDRHQSQLSVTVGEQNFVLNAVAHKRGMVVYLCQGDIPLYAQRRKIEHQVVQSAHEHIVIYSDGQREQIWQWVKREPGKPAVCREHRYSSNQPGDALLQKLEAISFSLAEEENLTLAHVTNRARAAFDLDRVTKKFYDRFQKEHDAFLAFVQGIPDDAMQRWYVSVMLNRIMFIYFIQKKGFLDGDLQYLRNKLDESTKRGADRFYCDFLCPLFFEGFAKKRVERSTAAQQLLGNVPYLNGSIFQKHQIEELCGQKIEISDAAFVRLFDFFEQYQWHLDERPLRSDNEINPDVLGYIFEKYINQKQMGAYYTKEDITDYISKNTVLPRLFDMARQKYKAAFDGENSIWQKLKTDPDRYIYDAVKHGTQLPLPPEIEAGLGDVAKRMAWNKAAPAEYALPTEIWREVVMRRKRYDEVKSKLANGEIHGINDLITYNLDIRQFAQDVIETCEEPELLRAVWYAIVGRIPEKSNGKFELGLSVLDPTCGSGAFLFAVLNILEPLYEACLERMQAFIAEATANSAGSKKFGDFSKILERVAAHPNRRYFILKTIIVNNLYGVDIMEEAIEICKLRLFLKLVAQVENADQIEPLPDIDFNIRAGNTLVGYASYDEVKRVVDSKLDFEDDMARIQEKAEEVDRLFALFRRQQTELGGDVRAKDKQELRKRLDELANELDQYLAGEYGVKEGQQAEFAKWKTSHKPFHWFIEFYGILKNGGFDVIIGNPPYVELKALSNYRPIGYVCNDAGNLYALVMERCYFLNLKEGRQGFIVPVSSISTDRYNTLQHLLVQRALHYSSFDDRPSRLFEGLEHCRLTIHLIGKPVNKSTLFSTRYNKWSAIEREALFEKQIYTPAVNFLIDGSLPKLDSPLEETITQKIKKQKSPFVTFFVDSSSYKIFYSRKVGYFLQVLNFEPKVVDGKGVLRRPSEFKELCFFDITSTKAALCCLNSSLFYWFVHTISDCRHVNKREIDNFPIDLLSLSKNKQGIQLVNLADLLMLDLQKHSQMKQMRFAHDTLNLQCIVPKYSKPILDEIDRVLAEHYGFTDEELDFIINYDIKYRMGRETEGSEEE
jgi:hypothetical protein